MTRGSRVQRYRKLRSGLTSEDHFPGHGRGQYGLLRSSVAALHGRIDAVVALYWVMVRQMTW